MEGLAGAAEEDEYFVVPASACKVELISISAGNTRILETGDHFQEFAAADNPDEGSRGMETNEAFDDLPPMPATDKYTNADFHHSHYRSTTHQMRLSFLEEESKYFRKMFKSYSREIKTLRAQLYLMEQWISSKFGTQLIDENSMYYKTMLFDWSEITHISESLALASSNSPVVSTKKIVIDNYPDPLSLDQLQLSADYLVKIEPEDTEELYSPSIVSQEGLEGQNPNANGHESAQTASKNIYWRYFTQLRAVDNNNDKDGQIIIENTCKKCGIHVSPQVGALRAHLLYKCGKDKVKVQAGRSNRRQRQRQVGSGPSFRLRSGSGQQGDQRNQNQPEILDRRHHRGGAGDGNPYKSNCWSEFTTRRNSARKIILNICNHCGSQVSPQGCRMRKHLKKCQGKPNRWKIRNFNNIEGDGVSGVGGGVVGGVPPTNIEEKIAELLTRSGSGCLKTKCWDYFNTVRNEETGKIVSNQCKSCGKEVSPQPRRMAKHLSRNCLLKDEFILEEDDDRHSDSVEAAAAVVEAQAEAEEADDATTDSNNSADVHVDAETLEEDFDLLSHAEPEPAEQSKGHGRQKSNFWSYFITTRSEVSGKSKIISNRCKKCRKAVSPQAGRMKHHLTKCLGQGSVLGRELVAVAAAAEQKPKQHVTLALKTRRNHIKANVMKSYQISQLRLQNPPPSPSLDPLEQITLGSSFCTCTTCNQEVPHKLGLLINHLVICQPEVGGPLRERLTNLYKQEKEKLQEQQQRGQDKGKQCEECGKIIVGHLSRHMATHSELRPAACPVSTCQKTFRTKHYLKMHVQAVHQGKRVPRAKRQR